MIRLHILITSLIVLYGNLLFADTGFGVSAIGTLDSQLPTVEVLYPNGGETLTIGETIEVSWSAADDSFGDTPIKIYFSYNGITYPDITDFEGNDGIFPWTIPNEPTDSAKIFILAVDEFGNLDFDYTDDLFSITGGLDVWHVSTSGSDETGDGTEENPFATIQFGINFSEDDDTVLVHSGTYIENIDFDGKGITVISAQGAANTIIEAASSGRILSFENEEEQNSILDGFTIRGIENRWVNTGIYFWKTSTTIKNCSITQCHFPVEMHSGAEPALTNNSFYSNDYNGIKLSGLSDTDWDVWDYGVPYYIDSHAGPATGTTMEIHPGVEIYFTGDGDEITVMGTVIADSVTFHGLAQWNEIKADGFGDGVEPELYLTNCTLNSVIVNVFGGSTLAVNNCSIDCSGDGVGVNISNSIASVENTTITGCMFPIAARYCVEPILTNNTFYDNIYDGIQVQGTAASCGHWTWWNYDLPYYINGYITVFEGDTLTISENNVIHFLDMNNDIEIRGTLSVENVSFIGHNLYNSLYVYGGSLNLASCTFDSVNVYLTAESAAIISSCEFSGYHNAFDDNIGISINNSDATIENSTLTDWDFPLAIWNSAEPVLTNNTLYDNLHDGIRVISHSNGNWTWWNYGIPYFIQSDVYIDEGDTLTIMPENSVEFLTSYDDIMIYGYLKADSINFFGDENLTEGGLEFWSNAGGLISNSSLIETDIRILSNANPMFEHNLFLAQNANTSNITCSSNSNPVFHNNDILIAGTNYSMENYGTNVIDATNNWWGNDTPNYDYINPGYENIIGNIDWFPFSLLPHYPDYINGTIIGENQNSLDEVLVVAVNDEFELLQYNYSDADGNYEIIVDAFNHGYCFASDTLNVGMIKGGYKRVYLEQDFQWEISGEITQLDYQLEPYDTLQYFTGFPDLKQPDVGSYYHSSCAPISAANILKHWADKGYSNFTQNYDDNALVVLLENTMGTDADGTYPQDVAPGIEAICNAQEYGNNYSFSATFHSNIDSSFWESCKTEIDGGRPFIIMTNDDAPYFSNHAMNVIGYYEEENTRTLILHQSDKHYPLYGENPILYGQDIEINYDEYASNEYWQAAVFVEPGTEIMEVQGDGIWMSSWSGFISQMNNWATNINNHGIETIYFNVGAIDPSNGMLIEDHIYQYETEILNFIEHAHSMDISLVANLGGVNDYVDFGNQIFRENLVNVCQTLINPPYLFDGIMLDIEPIPERSIHLENFNYYLSLLGLIKNSTGVSFLGTVGHPLAFDPAVEGAPDSDIISDWQWTEETYQYLSQYVDLIAVMAYLDCNYYEPELFDYTSYISETTSILAPLITPVTKLNIGIASYLDNSQTDGGCSDLNSQTLENGLIGVYNNPEFSYLNGLSIFRYNTMSLNDWLAWDNVGPDNNDTPEDSEQVTGLLEDLFEIITGYINYPFDSDWYSFATPPIYRDRNEFIKLNLDSLSSDINCDLFLYDSQLIQVDSSQNQDNLGEEITLQFMDSLYYLEVRGIDGFSLTEPYYLTFEITDDLSLEAEESSIPQIYSLYSNYPNPFNPVTAINYGVPESCDLKISIFDMRGRKLMELYNGNQKPGFHSMTWDGSEYSSGIYFAKMVAGNFTETRKLMLVK